MMRMILAAPAAWLLLASGAAAQEPCAEIAAREAAVTVPTGDGGGADAITVAPDPVHRAAVCYHNRASRSSSSGRHGVTALGLRITATVEINGGEGWAERVVFGAPEGMMVLPLDVQDVEDGQGVTVWIAEVQV